MLNYYDGASTDLLGHLALHNCTNTTGPMSKSIYQQKPAIVRQ